MGSRVFFVNCAQEENNEFNVYYIWNNYVIETDAYTYVLLYVAVLEGD